MTRPQKLSEFICSTDICNSINITLGAAKMQHRTFPHTLITGPPGTGKTTLAYVLANELDADIHEVMSNSITSEKQITSLFMRCKQGDVVFIDEIHSLKSNISEILYPIMEDFKMTVTVMNRPFQHNISPITIIGATTDPSTMLPPLMDRFGFTIQLSLYDNSNLSSIIEKYAKNKKYPITLDTDCSTIIAKVSRGTPRIAISYTDRIMDYLTVTSIDSPSPKDILNGLNLIGIDENGLTSVDHRIISTIYYNEPMSLAILSSMTGIQEKDLTSIYEPFLIGHGYIARTTRGRVLNEEGYNLMRLKTSI